MANRGASAAVQAEWIKAQNTPAHLIELQFDAGADGGPIYLTDTYRTVVWNGHSYIALGALLAFSGITESIEPRIADAVLQLQGVDQTYIAAFSQKQYFYRRLLVHQMFFDGTDTLIVDPVLIHDGRMDEPKFDEQPESGTCVVTVRSHDQFADFERTTGRHTNPNDQALWFPNDRAFDQIAQLVAQQQKFIWGRSLPAGPSVPGVSMPPNDNTGDQGWSM